jgi:hypothetical protein
VHVFEPLVKLLFIPHKPIPELVLPERPLAAAPGVKLTRRNFKRCRDAASTSISSGNSD